MPIPSFLCQTAELCTRRRQILRILKNLFALGGKEQNVCGSKHDQTQFRRAIDKHKIDKHQGTYGIVILKSMHPLCTMFC